MDIVSSGKMKSHQKLYNIEGSGELGLQPHLAQLCSLGSLLQDPLRVEGAALRVSLALLHLFLLMLRGVCGLDEQGIHNGNRQQRWAMGCAERDREEGIRVIFAEQG